MNNPQVVSRSQWLEARTQLLEKEKELTRLRDRISAERRALPWVRIDKGYEFEGPEGKETLGDLFAGRSQLLVQHFMFGPDWQEGCPSCSFWADGYDGFDIHLKHRDVTMVTVSRAPLDRLQAYRERMGWSFKWVSSLGSEFNRDFGVTFTADEIAGNEAFYNYRKQGFPVEEAPGISVFHRNEGGEIFHTYSCFSRGLDMMNAAYHYLDLVPKGRDEQDLPYGMAWLRRKDQYED